MNKKRFFIFALIFSLLIPPAYTASADFSQTVTTDADEHWAEDTINTLAALGAAVTAYGNTEPDSLITRAEFTYVITRAFAVYPEVTENKFSDVAENNYYNYSINSAAAVGIISGYPDGTFKPDNKITREEIMLMISRLTQTEGNGNTNFKDIKSSYKYAKELSKVTGDGIINGYPDGSFKPSANTTRAEAMTMILSALKKYSDPADIEGARMIANEYIYNFYASKDASIPYATGSALADRYYINHTYEKAAQLGYTLSNTVSEITYVTASSDGPFTQFRADYNVTRNINGTEKVYRASSDIKLITRNGETLVYEHNTRIIHNGPINLTWEVYSNPPSYDTYGVNAVSPTCFEISNKQGSNSQRVYGGTDTSLYFNSTLTDAYVNYAKQKNYEIWAMYKTSFSTDVAKIILNSPSVREAASDKLEEYILKYNLDGINFDYENMYRADKGAYTNHVKEIALMAHTLGASVSVDVTKYEPTSYTWSMCYDRDALAKYADYIAVMAYDQYYAGSPVAGPVAGLDWTESVIKLTMKEVPADKLILGMPYYIRYWEFKNGKKTSTKAISMNEAVKYVNENQATAEYDNNFKLTRYSWKKDDGTDCMLWMENAESIAARAKLANSYSLAGVASWRRGFETQDVWKALYDGLYSSN